MSNEGRLKNANVNSQLTGISTDNSDELNGGQSV